MKVFAWSACLLAIFFAALPAGAQKQTGSLPPDLDSYIEKVLQTFEVPGISVSIVKDGKVLLAKGYGIKKMGEQTPVDAHTLFLIASNTKSFTTTALAILEEEGKIKWDDPVINYLPWFRMSDDYVTTHITIRDILVHHSGIPAYAGDIMLFPPSTYSRKEILGKLADIPLIRGFRTNYAYDNILYLAAGEVISAVAGMPWEDFIQTRIFDKLGMTESISRFSTLKNKTNVASSHTRLNGKVHVLGKFMDLAIGDAGDPAGGICSNAEDMSKWIITQLDSGRFTNGRLFKPSATGQLWKVVTPMPISKVPEAVKPAQQDFWGYALGSRVYNYGKYKIVGHGGQLDGFVSQIAMVPAMNLGISVLTNQESGGAYWAVIYHVLDYYMHNPTFDWIAGYKSIMDSSLLKTKQEVDKTKLAPDGLARASLSLEKYSGLYRDAKYGDATITKENNRLVLRFSKFPMLTADIDHFRFDTFVATFRNPDLKADAYMLFSLDEKGDISQLKLKVISPESNIDFEDFLLVPVKP